MQQDINQLVLLFNSKNVSALTWKQKIVGHAHFFLLHFILLLKNMQENSFFFFVLMTKNKKTTCTFKWIRKSRMETNFKCSCTLSTVCNFLPIKCVKKFHLHLSRTFEVIYWFLCSIVQFNVQALVKLDV